MLHQAMDSQFLEFSKHHKYTNWKLCESFNAGKLFSGLFSSAAVSDTN